MKVLITYTAPYVQFEETVKLYKERYNSCIIYALSSASLSESVKTIPEIDKVIAFQGRFFNLFLFLPKIWKVKSEHFDEIAILYNNREGVGYTHLEGMAFLTGIKKITTSTSGLTFTELIFLSWLKRKVFAIESFKLLDTATAAIILVIWFLIVSIRNIPLLIKNFPNIRPERT